MVGRLNPANGEIKLVTLPTPMRDPYGIDIDSQGRAVGRVHRLLQGREHRSGDDGRPRVPCSDEKSTDPPPGHHQRRHGLVRQLLARQAGPAEPATGEIKEWPSPSGQDTQPYAITVVNDIIWYNESRRRPDALVRFDPKTERFQSWAIPSGVGTLRNMRATADGNLLIHQTSTNRIGLVTINRAATTSSR